MKTATPHFNLISLIWTDLTRHPGRVLLFLMVVISALAVILSVHHNRQLAIGHEQLMQQRDQLDVEWRHLVLEQSVLTEHNRLESLAAKELNMRRPEPADEIVVRIK
ncbi:cell division protein FtsL [Lacimicrobium alkaliphilum]|uniref:Cell division protein FtsL n=1 Tax=Lacimicrobium alkaliphilum TaxID=1526571 RepID=A0ABQ1QZA2_9ALTE|nr:cell division protein FtsL [Lacimicrobium alkaliphilum]GGD50977.1 cell division protein FtsL [Lacimicrobium alkaliphilum]